MGWFGVNGFLDAGGFQKREEVVHYYFLVNAVEHHFAAVEAVGVVLLHAKDVVDPLRFLGEAGDC